MTHGNGRRPHYRLGENDVVITVATDGADMYRSEAPKALAKHFHGEFSDRDAARVVGQYLLGADDSHVLELTLAERTRIFNLGYFTWVEQRGVSLDAFTVRARPEFWRTARRAIGEWDEAIGELNKAVRSAGTG